MNKDTYFILLDINVFAPKCPRTIFSIKPLGHRNAAMHEYMDCVTWIALRGLRRCYRNYGAMQVAVRKRRKQSAFMRPLYQSPPQPVKNSLKVSNGMIEINMLSSVLSKLFVSAPNNLNPILKCVHCCWWHQHMIWCTKDDAIITITILFTFYIFPFLEWQPSHFAAILFCFFRVIYLGIPHVHCE